MPSGAVGFDRPELVLLAWHAVGVEEPAINPPLELGVRHRRQVVLALQQADRLPTLRISFS